MEHLNQNLVSVYLLHPTVTALFSSKSKWETIIKEETNGFCKRLQQASQPEKVVQQLFEFDIDPRRLSAFPDTDKKGLTM